MIKNKKGQATLEFTITFVAIVIAILFMSLYVRRAFQGRLKEQADSIGSQRDGWYMELPARSYNVDGVMRRGRPNPRINTTTITHSEQTDSQLTDGTIIKTFNTIQKRSGRWWIENPVFPQ